MSESIERKKEKYVNYGKLRGPRTRAVADLNRLYVLTGLNAKALVSLNEEIYSTKKRAVSVEVVNRHGRQIETTKRRAKIKHLIDSSLSSELYRTALISSVAITESYLINLMSQMLTAYPRKIGKDKKIGVNEILSVGEHSDIVAMLVEKEILSSMYKKPAEYLHDLEKIASIEIPETLVYGYSEIKATRDLCVHGQGIINEAYVAKSGNLTRGAYGDAIKVDSEYFAMSTSVLKNVVQTIFEAVLLVHGNSEEISISDTILQSTAFGVG